MPPFPRLFDGYNATYFTGYLCGFSELRHGKGFELSLAQGDSWELLAENDFPAPAGGSTRGLRGRGWRGLCHGQLRLF